MSTKLNRAIQILNEASKNNAVLSFSGGIDSTTLHHIIQHNNIPINTIFVNKVVEHKYNHPIITDTVKYYDEVIYAIPKRTYKEIIWEFGFPIKNKDFSHLCYRLARVPLSLNNVVDKYRVTVGINPYHAPKYINKPINQQYALPLKYWYLATNYPIQNYCCTVLKKAPSKKVGRPMVIGIMADDSPNRRRAINSNFNGKKYYPLAEWKKSDILSYVREYNIPTSKIYQNRWVGDVEILGGTNSGCTGCHYGNTTNHKLRVNGEVVNTTKLHILSLEQPKQYRYYMNMKHKGGKTYAETLDIYDRSSRGEFMAESVAIRNDYIQLIKSTLQQLPNIPDEAYQLLDRLIV